MSTSSPGPFVPAVFAEPGRDDIEQLAEHIERDVDRDGWDQPMRLYVLNATDVGGLLAFGVTELQLPNEVAYCHPVEVLAMFGGVVQEMQDVSHLLDSFAGLAMATEGWSVQYGKDDEEYARAVREASGRRELHLHPDRKECRQLNLFLLPNKQVQVTRKRGEDPFALSGNAVTGTVPNAVRILAFVLGAKSLGLTVPNFGGGS